MLRRPRPYVSFKTQLQTHVLVCASVHFLMLFRLLETNPNPQQQELATAVPFPKLRPGARPKCWQAQWVVTLAFPARSRIWSGICGVCGRTVETRACLRPHIVRSKRWRRRIFGWRVARRVRARSLRAVGFAFGRGGMTRQGRWGALQRSRWLGRKNHSGSRWSCITSRTWGNGTTGTENAGD